MSMCLNEITLRSMSPSGRVARGLPFIAPLILSQIKPNKNPSLNIHSIRPSLCWRNVLGFPSVMEKITISSLWDSCTPMSYKEWKSKTKQILLASKRRDLLKYIFPHLHAEFALMLLQMTKNSKQNFLRVRKVTHSCFTITPAFMMWNFQGDENITIWTCTLTSTQRTCHETYRRDGIRCSVSLTRCADDMGWHGGGLLFFMGNLRLIDLNLEMYRICIMYLLASTYLMVSQTARVNIALK